VGLKQLDIARDILFQSGKYRYILQRLVYVAAEPVTVLEELPTLSRRTSTKRWAFSGFPRRR